MDFVAIDFETANAQRTSACSLGITVVKNNKIVEEKYWLIKPEPFIFDLRNIFIHGIRPKDVENEREFHKVWPEIKPYLENNLVIAHNASFDFSVLRKTLDLYNIEYPDLQYCCTLVASKIFYGYLENHKLNTVNKHLDYSFKHHHASEDATAAANILINIANELESKDINYIAEEVGFKLGILREKTYSPCSKIKMGRVSNKCNMCNKEGSKSLFSSKTHYFQNKIVVFTGELYSMSRAKATVLVNNLGGIVRGSVTKKTDIVITNAKGINNLNPNQMSNKLRTAVNYRNKGQEIMIINEEEFEKILINNIVSI
ncbi:MAG: exonuclease domain-containing protein [Terrisporobacter sp.]|uniref:exonuclease domain-containing protein n=1 Tax=Terrisporobacter sp. TaxID=1965305 RepID=UPI002FC5D15D